MREIGIVPLCGRDELLRREFVQPLARLVAEAGFTPKIIEPAELSKAEIPCILSGTALKDFAYLEDTALIETVKQFPYPLLGICAGAHIIALAIGGKLVDSTEIGIVLLAWTEPESAFKDATEAYALHTKGVELPTDVAVLARNASGIQAFRKRDKVGVLFHPEVGNEVALRELILALGPA